MKFSRKALLRATVVGGLFAGVLVVSPAMPQWIPNIEAGSLLEAAIFRAVALPGGPITIRRPPSETVPALDNLIKRQPRQSELYSLKALEEEQKLDFAAAEADWKLYVQNGADIGAAHLAMADFYERRHRPLDQITELSAAARLPLLANEKFTAIAQQRSWMAFERIFLVVEAQALGRDIGTEQYDVWLERYPQEQGLYGRYFQYLLDGKDFKAAERVISRYHSAFPSDEIFPTRARALLAYRQGSVEQGLAVYDKNFQPMWPAELVKNYFDLLKETRSLRSFLDQTRAALARNPDDLNAVSRLFYYYQQQGNLAAAEQSITEYRLSKDSRRSPWSSQELYTFAQLLEAVQLYPEAARYYFALYNSPGSDAAAPERALTGLANILLAAPDQPIRLGSGDISMYKDIATMDTGPGYLNGILSLLLNSTAPGMRYTEEEQSAQPYFHRSRAAELVALVDQKFPSSAQRAELHARLLEAYAGYGQNEAVIRAGRTFLTTFPDAGQRNQVALFMADAFARTGNTREEFSIYDSMLRELARKADGIPLGEHRNDAPDQAQEAQGEAGERESESEADSSSAQSRLRKKRADKGAFHVASGPSGKQDGPRSPEYERVLERYISRLVSQKQIPAALAVWRQELDRNPNDPGLYERFAAFLEGNKLGTEEQAIYKRAIQQFPGRGWYDKLARWYLRQKRVEDFAALTQQVSKIFSGSDLEAYLTNADMPEKLSFYFNGFALQRFPHNLTFVRNLLSFYASGPFRDPQAWEALLRQHWFEDQTLRGEFFEFLSRTGKLDRELQEVRTAAPAKTGDWLAQAKSNPAAVRFVAEGEVWKSHFEDGAPALAAVSMQYPADVDLGERASSIYRSLAYFNPKNTELAVQIETNLLQVNPASRDRLARVGDIYSDREQFDKAAPYWNQMVETEPGKPESYQEAAAVFWDYYFFDDALRLLNQGRAKLHNDALYSYQMGAVYENKRDYPRAVQEYANGALADGAASESRARLLQLARRPSTKDLVDAATQKIVSGNADMEAIELRVAVLEAQSEAHSEAHSKKSEIVALLTSALDRINAVEVLESIEAMAKEKSLESVRQHALERQAAISNDPVRRMELRYALVNFYEQKKDMISAQHNVDALYRDSPMILGVVRSTVDFYWRNNLQQRAIDVLLQAAARAYPSLKQGFTLEAARKMTDAGQYLPARQLLLVLLNDSPYNGEYLAAVADTYARAGDQAGLRDFYLEKIKLFQKASLAADDRKSRVAALRRGLIPALTVLKDYAGTVDQYIEIINSFPDDTGLTTEAAFYAQRYQRKDQLLTYYVKTVAASPKDSRWPVVLARLQTNNEDFDSAIATYSQAIKIRPDRTDLLIARATLEERLLRFEEAVADYTTLYQLAYHDSKWMEKVAETRARQGKPDLAVAALQTALIEGRPEAASKYYAVAGRLESWGMLTPAKAFAEKGLALAANDLLGDTENHPGAQIYVRIMTRLRQYYSVYAKLEIALAASKKLPPLTQEVAKDGVEAATNAELRQNLLLARINNGRNGMTSAMKAMGATVNRYFTPEEKLVFAQFLNVKDTTMGREDAFAYVLPAAETAELPDLEVMLINQQLAIKGSRMASPDNLREIQMRRLKLLELAQQFERLGTIRSESRFSYLQRAQDAYNLAGKPDDELRVLEQMGLGSAHLGSLSARYFELLLAKDPQRLVTFAGDSKRWGDLAANFVVAHGDANLAHAALAARGATEPPVWLPSYHALVGLYFAEPSPLVQGAFTTALADNAIGERLAKPLDRKQALAGDIWFYYGSRYGEYLGLTHKGDPEDFVPSDVEHTPARAGAYFNAALYYEESGDLTRALADYHHVLELDANRIDVHNRLADIHWKQKRREAALDEWKRALELLGIEAATRSGATFWGDFSVTQESIAARGVLAQFQPAFLDILRAYVKRSGSYRLNTLLQGTFSRLGDAGAASALLLELSGYAPDKLGFLRPFVFSCDRLHCDPEPIYRQAVDLAQDKVRNSEGLAKDYAQTDLEGLQIRWLQSLRAAKKYDRLRDEMNALPKATVDAHQADLVPIQLQLAAQSNGLDAILEGYRTDADHAPLPEVLRAASTQLQQTGDKQSARKILEFVFAREIQNHNLTAANMLGLADLRLQAGDLAGGVTLLRRMTLVAGAPFETQDPAALLLVRTGHPAEAVSFLDELVKAVPWKVDYRIRLAQARIAANQDIDAARSELLALASDKQTPYETRVAAARSLAGPRLGSDLGGKELNMLAEGRILSLADANQPYFFAARLKLAEGLSGAAKVAPLRAALEDRPSGDAARVPLLHAAILAGDFHLAIAAMRPYLDNNTLVTAFKADSPEEDDLADMDAVVEDTVHALAKLSARERAEINKDIGLAFEKTGSLEQSIRYWRNAYKLETNTAEKTKINKEVRQMRAVLKARASNLARIPLIHSELEQNHLVRPRLAEHLLSTPPPVPGARTTGKGVSQ